MRPATPLATLAVNGTLYTESNCDPHRKATLDAQDFANLRVSSVVFINCASITTIGANFLASCQHLTHVDLSAFCNVTIIGHGCLSQCPALTHVDFSAMASLTTVGDAWLAVNPALRTVVWGRWDGSPLWVLGG